MAIEALSVQALKFLAPRFFEIRRGSLEEIEHVFDFFPICHLDVNFKSKAYVLVEHSWVKPCRTYFLNRGVELTFFDFHTCLPREI